ncbi:MAG TPA: ABC transporter ATP-binding protein [Acidimicrobiia bacterium]|nr:ABC transporter ATP-binding protein [Acidimicrobiia bacterium]
MTSAISVRGVSKRFKLAHERYPSLKERMIHFGNTPHEDFWALRGIDLEIPEGATTGLLGHNGSGKSTLLKCIAGILRPTAGEIETRGRVAALLELGAGFQSELTGRENVFLNGAILGMSKRDLAQRFDDIVAFAELEQFIDTQVRFYSSGMYVRLGFAIAVSVEPDILLVDEVLAVGDESFQRKCLERVEQFQREGRTIVVVSHAPDLVSRICQSAAVLDHGQLVSSGDPKEAVQVFREHLRKTPPRPRPGEPPVTDDRVRVTGVRFEHPGSPERAFLEPGEPLSVHVAFEVDAPVDDPVFTLMIYDAEGQMRHGSGTATEHIDTGHLEGPGEVVFAFDEIPLLDGEYAITLCVTSSDGAYIYDWQEQRYHFEVRDPSRTFGPDDFAVQISIQPAAIVDRLTS